ncbi:carbohydrate ABC transporter permease [Mycoplasma tauri]|uniref:Sugar ABC transporter permease n=1 Tax=Mycoplasma tauri TaxID=547987 RepID=A0A953NC31_9MOLU|nr:sugar ABC transporter permease [Mycoplasma tauri]MBZ4195126.1 sugar ABC transporter permease [Mycoplasma tauri]MBZ4203728.1 sugar ABC transporter permease [Mycoplasma tauri]MBZ4204259.1 sugar ABC transporter permease [Mycoplasma tauri]MBZ4212401.1 sugar ABC transporter permease [Mycoplasma tauri]MBZ4218172.1 sugar ABC transporter permease [Mycoplasma tauri]
MKLKNKHWAKISHKSPFLAKMAMEKQAENKTESVSESVVLKRTPSWKPLSMLLPTFIIILVFTIIPLFINIKHAFYKTDDNLQMHFTLEHYRSLIQDPFFAVGVRNSLIYALIVLPFVMAISLLISSCIASVYNKSARGIWQTVFFLPYITNIVAISLSFIQFFAPNGLYNNIVGSNTAWLEKGGTYNFEALFPMLVNGVWSGLAFNILIFTTAMLSVDKNLYKSASIDGIGGIKQFFTITLPSIKSTTTFLITMGIINGIKVFPLALFKNDTTLATANGASTLMLYVYHMTNTGNDALASASSVVLFIIGLVYSLLIRRGFNAVILASINLGESNVWNKIKNSPVMIEYQTKKE